MKRSQLIGPLAIGLIGLIALVGVLLSQQDSLPVLGGMVIPPSSSLQTPPSPVAITPRGPANATLRTTLTPRPTRADGAPAPTLTPPAPDSPEPLPPLIFARDGQLWRSDGSAAAPKQLTNFAVGSAPSQPSIAPDGTQIAFVALIQPPITATLPLPSSKLFLIDIDGSHQRELWAPKEGILWLPTWAPDGTALYLLANGTMNASGDGGTERLQIMRFDLKRGVPETILTGALDPTISRDGKQLAFLRFDPDGVTMHVELADLDGSHARRLITGTKFLGFYAPRFTPDGKQVIVAAIEGPPTDDRGYPLAQRTPSNSANWLLGLFAPATAQAHGAPWDLWVVNTDGTGLRRLTKLYEDLPMAAFSPDGQTVAIMAYNGVYLMAPDGSNLRRIDRHGDHGGLDWIR
jgi:Tol biopolymer transport system component